MGGNCGSAISSVAEAVMILSSATCALVASSGDTALCLVPMWVEGKQLADAPESSAAWMGGEVVLAKVTFLGVVTRSAFPVFKIDLADWRDGRDEMDELAEVTVGVWGQGETTKAAGVK